MQKVGVGRGAKFVPTEIGFVVTDLLVANFPYIFDPQYTARLEEELDDIEDGKEVWTTLLGAFYGHFEKELEHAGKHMENIKRMEKPTDEKCDVCGSPLVLKWGKFGSFFACSTYNKKDKNSCTFTKENFAAKPEMNTQEGQEGEQAEEYCEACGRVMVLKRGRFGAFMACPGYNEDPPCKTTRKLTQKQQQKAPQPLDENCPKCGLQLVLRNGQYGEFVSCSGYPKCKYIKQNLVEGMKCPKCGDGDIAERKARRGNLFYGCTNYPKCDFTSNAKPVPEKCPECGSPYLLEKTRTTGTYLVCPNNRKSAAEDEAPKKRAKKGAAEEPAEQVALHLLQEDRRAPGGIRRGHALSDQGRAASGRLNSHRPPTNCQDRAGWPNQAFFWLDWARSGLYSLLKISGTGRVPTLADPAPEGRLLFPYADPRGMKPGRGFRFLSGERPIHP